VLKWPNDLVTRAQGRAPSQKIAGVLCETRWAGTRAQVIVGFGINVRHQAFSPEIDAIATSLQARVPGLDITPREVLGCVLEHLEPVLDAFLWPSGGFAAIRERYQQHCITLGQTVTRTQQIRGVTTEVTGQVVGLSALGALRVRTPSGVVHTVQSVG
ncbi:MAG: biotin--[acetyl-CoA-carboxylase] ligase, partial [Nannocystaceae bacterium]